MTIILTQEDIRKLVDIKIECRFLKKYVKEKAYTKYIKKRVSDIVDTFEVLGYSDGVLSHNFMWYMGEYGIRAGVEKTIKDISKAVDIVIYKNKVTSSGDWSYKAYEEHLSVAKDKEKELYLGMKLSEEMKDLYYKTQVLFVCNLYLQAHTYRKPTKKKTI